ncbi:MAG: TolC family protein [Phycisphaerae bacterium]
MPLVLVVILGAGCDGPHAYVNEIRPPMVQPIERTGPTTSAPALMSLDNSSQRIAGAQATTQPSIDEIILLEIPDPSAAEQVYRKRIEMGRGRFSDSLIREAEAVYFGTRGGELGDERGALSYMREIERPKKVRLSLWEAIRRATANNYSVHAESYGPAISTAQVVQAEAAFDAAFFTNLNGTVQDRPTPSPLVFGRTNATVWQTGVRKLLATGATATLSFELDRSYQKLSAQARSSAINPAYNEIFTAELRQPFLRNFGIDFTRANINIRKNERRIAVERFRRTLMDRLNETERAYWTLAFARRNVVITAELLSQAERTLSQVIARIDYDAYQTLRANSEAAVEARRAEYIQVKNAVLDAEDALLNLLNDAELPLRADVELIPTDVPTAVPIVRDRYHEIETAVFQRPEIKEAQYSIELARLQLGVAKNQALPQLDGIFRITANGLGRNGDKAFDQVAGWDYADGFVGLEFLWNFAERAERAGIRAAKMAESQSVYVLKQTIEAVITDCRTQLRALNTSYESVLPNAAAVESSRENLRSIQEREERKSPEQLNTVLQAQVQLAGNRRNLLQALTQYNQAISAVERAKGTLLDYNNITVGELPEAPE